MRARHGRIWCREGELDLDGRGGAEGSARTCPGTSGVGTLRASLGLRRWGRRRGEHLSPRRAEWTFPRNHLDFPRDETNFFEPAILQQRSARAEEGPWSAPCAGWTSARGRYRTVRPTRTAAWSPRRAQTPPSGLSAPRASGCPAPAPGANRGRDANPSRWRAIGPRRPSSEAISTFRCRRRLRRTAMGRAGTMG